MWIAMTALVALMVLSCTTVIQSGTPIAPTPIADVKAQTLEALNALQSTWGETAPDVTALQTQAADLRKWLATLCSAYLPVEEAKASPTESLVAKTAPAQIAPSTALPSSETPSPERTEQLNDALGESQRAPNPQVLQARAASEQCRRAMALLSVIEDTLTSKGSDLQPPVDVLAQLGETINQIPSSVP